MRDSLKSTAGWLWVLVYLALPDCSFSPGAAPTPNLIKGPKPWSSAIFCDIEKKSEPGGHRRCANDTDLMVGTRLEHAAVALTTRQADTSHSNIGLDYRPGAPAESGLTCDPGVPVAIVYEGPFPEGYTGVCLNCTGATEAEVLLACVDQCKDINGGFKGNNPPDVVAFCENTDFVHTSTNAKTCFDDACAGATGVLLGNFVDPRRTPEAVDWTDVVGVGVSGAFNNTLTRTAATTNPPTFDAGAASTQLITRGSDGYVEFTATETTTARAGGLTSGVVPGTPDSDPSLNDISFAIRLTIDGQILISENSTLFGPLAQYVTGDRMRVTVTDNLNGTANIAYFKIPAGFAGAQCPEQPCPAPLRTAGPAPYPFRVDASLRDQGATLTDVRIVRIK